MYKQKSRGFTLIEIMISTIILGTGVFGVYKLIGSNMSVISSMGENIVVDSISLNSSECLKNIGYNTLKGGDNIFFLDFGNNYNNCNITTYDNSFSSSGIIIDNSEYYIVGKITDSGSVVGSEFLKIQIKVIGDNTKDKIKDIIIKK